MLTPADHERIAQAIAAVEQRTSGEVYCVVAEEVSRYREVPIAWAAAAALIIPPAAVLLGWRPEAAADMFAGWSGPTPEAAVMRAGLTVYAVVQALVFAGVALVVAIPAVRRMATPRFLKRRRVKRSAYAHFASTGLAGDPGRTGVLIFASLRDRQAELVADETIHQAVGDARWREAMAALLSGLGRRDPAEGFVRAIEICSSALETHAPKGRPRGPQGDGVLEI